MIFQERIPLHQMETARKAMTEAEKPTYCIRSAKPDQQEAQD